MDRKTFDYYTSLVPEISEEEWVKWNLMTEMLARQVILPPSWSESPPFDLGHPCHGIKCFRRNDGLNVLFSYFDMDGKPWLHVSMSRHKRIPSYEDMLAVKNIFVGNDRQAIQVFPRTEKHLNINEYVLHLWCGLEGDGLPDFGRYGVI